MLRTPGPKETPTLKKYNDFDAAKDAQALRKAMKGIGTDEEALINILCYRSNEQRQAIKERYKSDVGRDLVEDIKSETSGDFKKVMVALHIPTIDYYCIEIHDALAKKNGSPIIQLLCSLTNEEVKAVRENYGRMYELSLEKDISTAFSDDYLAFMIMLIGGNRKSSDDYDSDSAETDARKLNAIIKGKTNVDAMFIFRLLLQTNLNQLKLILDKYKKIAGHALDEDIKSKFSGDIGWALLDMYQYVTNKYLFYATKLKESMAGIGTNDKQLIRIIVTRCEIDMLDIILVYNEQFGSLSDWIKGDTSGDYKAALYALIGEEDD